MAFFSLCVAVDCVEVCGLVACRGLVACLVARPARCHGRRARAGPGGFLWAGSYPAVCVGVCGRAAGACVQACELPSFLPCFSFIGPLRRGGTAVNSPIAGKVTAPSWGYFGQLYPLSLKSATLLPHFCHISATIERNCLIFVTIPGLFSCTLSLPPRDVPSAGPPDPNKRAWEKSSS